MELPKTKTKSHGINANAFVYRGNILWNSAPTHIKSCEALSSFKIVYQRMENKTV